MLCFFVFFVSFTVRKKQSQFLQVDTKVPSLIALLKVKVFLAATYNHPPLSGTLHSLATRGTIVTSHVFHETCPMVSNCPNYPHL